MTSRSAHSVKMGSRGAPRLALDQPWIRCTRGAIQGSQQKEPAHGQGVFEEGAGNEVIRIIKDDPARIPELVGAKRPDIHALTLPIDDFVIWSENMRHAVCREQARDGLVLLMYQVDAFVLCQRCSEHARELFSFPFLAVGDNNNGAIDGKIPEHSEEDFAALVFMRNHKSGARQKVVQILKIAGLQDMRKLDGVNVHVALLHLR